MPFESSLPQFKCPLATKQRNIALALTVLIGTITIVCAAYLELKYGMTFELYITTIIGWLCSIVTGVIVMMNAYDIEEVFEYSKDDDELKRIYGNGRICGNSLFALSLIIVLTVTYYYIPIS